MPQRGMPRATSHLETDVPILQRSLSRVQSLYRQSIPSQFAQLASRGSGCGPREKLVHGARERQAAPKHCGSFMIRMNNSKALSRSSASWTNWSFCVPTHLKITQEVTSLFGCEVQCCSRHSSLRHHAAASGDNNGLSTLWREVISLADVAKSLSCCLLDVTLQSLTRQTGISH